MPDRTESSRVEQQRTWVGRWQSRKATVQDGLMTGVLTVLAFVPPFDGAGVVLGGLRERPLDALGVALVVAQSLPLLLRRRWPLMCLAVVTAVFSVHQALGYPATVAGLGLYIALYSVGAHQSRFRHGAAAAFTVAYALLSTILAALGSPEDFFGFATFFLVLLAFGGAGAWVRSWRAGEAERSRQEAELTLARERARIARELHDVVTHHVTAMVVQADAAQYVTDRPDELTVGLGSVSDTGRRALTELRHLLDVLDASGAADGASGSADAAGGSTDAGIRAEGDAADGVSGAGRRTPAIDRLDELIDETRKTGQAVEMTQEGERMAMDSGVELAVYRVVQEGLTNAVKHARHCPTAVQVRYGTEAVEVEVSTEGSAVTSTPPGRGLTGLKERVGLLGGELRAGGSADGGFTVEARIPSRGTA